MRKKEYLARVLAITGAGALCGFLRRFIAEEILILAYHRVYDLEDEAAFPFDPELISASRREFAWQMGYIRKHCHPITFQTLLDAMDGRSALPERPVIVTFDDGYDDNYHNAFPILKSLDVPATFFIATGYIGSEQPFWFDRVAYVVYNAPAGALRLEGLPLALNLDGDVASRRAATCRILGALKNVSDRQRTEFLERFEHDHVSAFDATCLSLSRPLDWEQVREMSAAGMEFGSHTVTHPVLSKLDDDALLRELADSRIRLEKELGKPIPVLAYPVGVEDAFDDRVVQAAASAGYRLAASYVAGINRLDRLDRFRLRRQHVERYTSRPWFSGLLNLPAVFA